MRLVRSRPVKAAFVGISSLLVLAALSGCGGGIDDESQKATPTDGAAPRAGAARAETDAARAGTVFRGQLNAALSPTEFPLDAHLKGVFAPVANWPLIAAHAVLMPDGRVLSYGTDGNGTQTGFFIYDIWDPKLGLGPEAHLTLPNTTNTDVFCSSQLVLPQGGGVFVTGGDNWTGTGTTNTGNRNSNV